MKAIKHFKTYDWTEKRSYSLGFSDGYLVELEVYEILDNLVPFGEKRIVHMYKEPRDGKKNISDYYYFKALDSICKDRKFKYFEEILAEMEKDKKHFKYAARAISLEICNTSQRLALLCNAQKLFI